MKTDIIKQEILIVITASQKEACVKNSSKSFRFNSPAEQLEKACWNGLLDELVGCIVESSSGKRLCLWKIQHGKSFLEIELCNYPQRLEKHLSIVPYTFLPTQLQN